MNLPRLLVVWLLLAITAPINVAFAAPDNTGMVSVSITADASSSRVGFVADDRGHIIARINAPNKKLFIRTADGNEHTAQTVAYDTLNNLALLKVDGSTANLKPYTFALDPAKPQRKVFGIKPGAVQSQTVTGTLANIQQAQSTERPNYYLHNALVGKTGMGGPLFNNCSEIIGVIIPQPKFLARLFLDEEETTAYAVPIEWLVTQFSTHGMQSAHADNTCLSETEQAAAATAAAQNELDAVKRQLDEAEGASEEERQRLQEEITARQAELDEAREREADKQAEFQAALDTATIREQQYIQWSAIGAVALLLLLLLLWIFKQRAVKRAKHAQANLDIREKDEARIRAIPNVFMDGKDAEERTVAVRIPGASIAREQGATIGRNPTDSDFVINHPVVSRKQFRLFSDGGLLMIEDLGSTNGTIVDGKRLSVGEETTLTDLSRVELGDLKLSVRFELD